MNDTGIIWTEHTWNPASGCVKVDAGCKYCYAETLAENRRGTPAFPNGFDLTLRPHKLREPFKLKKPSLIFVNSMSDLFWEAITDDYRDKVLDVIEATPQHQYQVLTKRPDVMLRYSKRRKLPSNFWAGTTIATQKNVDERLEPLAQVDAEIRFISAEPLLEPLDFRAWFGLATYEFRAGGKFHWLITGGESGAHLNRPEICLKRGLAMREGGYLRGGEAWWNPLARWIPRPERIGWVRDIRDQCVAAGVAFFHKQWGGTTSHSAGRELDGRTWDQFPRYPTEGGWKNPRLPGVAS